MRSFATIPSADVPANPRKTLAAASVAEPRHRSHERIFQRHRIIPPISTASPLRGFERLTKTNARVAHGDLHDAPAESLLPSIGLHGDPSAALRVLDDVLARLRQRHCEAHRRARVEVELLREDGLCFRLNPADDFVHVLALGDRCDLEQHVRLCGAARAGYGAMHLEEILRVAKKVRARPIRRGFLPFRRVQRRPLGARLSQAQERGEPIRRGPAGVTRVNEHTLVRRQRSDLLQHRLECAIVQRWRNVYDSRHRELSSTRRWPESPVAPRCSTLRAAAWCAARIASIKLSPARSREKYVAPHTSPQPVESPVESVVAAGMSAVRMGPSAAPSGACALRSARRSNPGAAKKTAPLPASVTFRHRTWFANAVAASAIG